MRFQELPRELDMLRLLIRGGVDLWPLSVVAAELQPALRRGRGSNAEPDAELVLRWQKNTFRFAVECRSLFTPKEIASAVKAARQASRPPRLYPMVYVPYLAESQARRLQEQQVSGVDMCGNAVLIVPGELLVFRTGAPNMYPRSGRIKNVYRKNSSIVARSFLLKPTYPSMGDLMDEIEGRGGKVTQATVSKVCAALDQDLVIERAKGELPRTTSLRLVQPDKLLELLRTNYVPPLVKQRLTAKTSLVSDDLRRELAHRATRADVRVVLTGSSSVGSYAVMAREPIESFYCSNLDFLLRRLGSRIEDASRFPNIELLETDDDFVYFDSRESLAASPIQTYLELMRGDKREQKTAEQVRRMILNRLSRQG